MLRVMQALERDCPEAKDGVSVADTGMWLGSAVAIASLVVLVIEPSWRGLVDLAYDLAFVLIAAVAGAGWLRVQRLEAQRAELARKLSAEQGRYDALKSAFRGR